MCALLYLSASPVMFILVPLFTLIKVSLFHYNECNDVPTALHHQIKHSLCISDNFFYLGGFLKKITDDQCSSLTKGSIHHIKHISIQPFSKAINFLFFYFWNSVLSKSCFLWIFRFMWFSVFCPSYHVLLIL